MTSTYILIGVILYLGVMNYIDRQKATKRENDLLNRLMARDLAQYAQAVKSLDTTDTLLKDASPEQIMDQVNRIDPQERDVLPVG